MSAQLLKLAQPVDPKRIGNAVECVVRSLAQVLNFIGSRLTKGQG